MKVLFISYFFEPEPAVGAKRISYWAKHFKEHSPESEVYVITSTENPSDLNIDKIITVKSKTKKLLSYLIKDEGLNWGASIKEELMKYKLSPTHIVISGSPFMQFALIPFFKKQYSAKILLDYRDPFAVNPRFKNSGFKVWMKRYFERKFNREANAILSVNSYCLELLEGYKKDQSKFDVIANGYDESEMPKLKSEKKPESTFNLVYAGTFYEDRSPKVLLEALSTDDNLKLVHMGRTSTYLENSNSVIYEGMKNYKEMLSSIGNQNAGLIITSGEPFESTTKVYDYIAMKVPIFVITSGEIGKGAIADDLANYPSVWAQNNTKSILEGIEKLKHLGNLDTDVEHFSRENGLKKLISILEKT